MITLIERIKAHFMPILQGISKEIEDVAVTQATNPKFGHYQCNAALSLAKELKKKPRDIAQEILSALPEVDWITKYEIAGPGFINIHLSQSCIEDFLTEADSSENLSVSSSNQSEKVIVEFSSPNVAKELHVGHLRSTIIGDSIARLLETLGHDVLRLNHIGDWGTQFGMLISYIEEFESDTIRDATKLTLPELMGWYQNAKKLFDEDEAFRVRSQKRVVDLQAKEPKAYKIWETLCEISRTGYQEIYDLLDVRLNERGESFYNSMLSDVVKELDQKGLTTVSDNAKCIFLDGYFGKDKEPLPMIVQKSDGGYNYSTTDMAAMKQRFLSEKADRVIVITDAGQKLHFSMVQDAAKKAGYLKSGQMDHITFGVVLSPDGKKFKTRSGKTEKLMDLLTSAIDFAKKLLHERYPSWEESQLEHAARVLGINAVKYSDLSCHRQKDYVFSYEKMLRFDGNTAAFLLYSYVRIQSIKRKVGDDQVSKASTASLKLKEPSEMLLGLHVARIGEVLKDFERDLLPNRLCEYLFQLAEHFNGFFRDCQVDGHEAQQSRLRLCLICEKALKLGFDILGLKTLDRM